LEKVLLEYLQHGSSTVQRKAFWELFPGILVLCAFESFANCLELDMIGRHQGDLSCTDA
jgi:hypothetical protein